MKTPNADLTTEHTACIPRHTPGPWRVSNDPAVIDQLLEALEALLEADQAIERASDLLPDDRSLNRFNAMMRARAAINAAKGETL